MTLFSTHDFGGLIVKPSVGASVVFATYGGTRGGAGPDEVLARLGESEVRDLIDVLQEAIAR